MASEIRVDKINSLSGVGTVTLSPTGVDIAGITTAATLRATTGIVTSLTAGSLTSLGAVSGTTGTFSGALSGTTGTFSGAVSGTTGTFTGNVAVSGANITLQDSGSVSDDRLIFGADSDLMIYHNGSDSVIREQGTGNLDIQTTGGNVDILVNTTETAAKFISDGAVELYHNGTKKFETSSSGITISGNNSTGSYIKGVTRFTPNDSTTVKVMWDEGGFSGAGAFQVKDNVAFTVGDSSDLKIYHDGSHSYINDSGTGNLRVLTNSFTVNNTANSANLAQFTEGGSVELFHNGTKQCETSANGLAFPSGKGIDFSATTNGGTMSSELLDDYEEGTWTPVLNGTTSNMGTGVGKYAKVGSITHYWIEFGHISAGNGSFNANSYITGFPYSTPNHPPNHWTGTSSYMNSAYGMTLLTNYYNSADQFYITQAAGSLRYLWCQVSVCNF